MEDPNILITSVESLPYLGIFVLFLLANVIIPIPEEIFIVILGYVGGAGLTNLWIAVPIAITGFFISDMIIFSLTRSGNKYVTKVRESMLSGLLPRDVLFLKKHVKKVIFFSRFLVGFRFLGPATAGMVRVPARTFAFYNFIALIIYVPFLVSIGYYFQDKISAIIDDVGAVRHYLFLISATVLFFVFSGTIRRGFVKMFSMLTTMQHNGKQPDISITAQSESDEAWEMTVRVFLSGSETEHQVTLPKSYAQELSGGTVSPTTFIKHTFRFLLERESNDAILKRFSVPEVETYFPSFREYMKNI